MKILILFCWFLTFSHAFSAEILPWTSKTGHSFEGSFVSKDANIITLKGKDGKTVEVPINVLDEKSLIQLEKVYAEAPKNAPIFIYQSTFYRYAIYPRQDWLHLEFLQAGKPLNPEPYILQVSLGEKVGKDWKSYRITGMDGAPIETKDEVELRLNTDRGVTIRLFAAKKASKDFSFHFSFAESSPDLDKLYLRNTLGFEAMLTYDIASKTYKGPLSESGYTFEELPNALKEYSIEYRSDKKSTKVGYHEKQEGSKSGTKLMINHPKHRELTVDRGENTGTLNVWFYGGKAPIEGYRLKFEAKNDGAHEAGPFTLELK